MSQLECKNQIREGFLPNLERIQFITRLLKVQLRIENKNKRNKRKTKQMSRQRVTRGYSCTEGWLKRCTAERKERQHWHLGQHSQPQRKEKQSQNRARQNRRLTFKIKRGSNKKTHSRRGNRERGEGTDETRQRRNIVAITEGTKTTITNNKNQDMNQNIT